MKIKDIYEQYTDDLQTKDPQYKKLAVLNYGISASGLLINLIFILLFSIPNSLPSGILGILLIIYLIIGYFVNIIFVLITIINVILHYRINRNIHWIMSLISCLILLSISIVSIILL